MSDLEKYIGAVERDVDVFERELETSRGARRATTRPPEQENESTTIDRPPGGYTVNGRRQKPPGSGKSWRDG